MRVGDRVKVIREDNAFEPEEIAKLGTEGIVTRTFPVGGNVNVSFDTKLKVSKQLIAADLEVIEDNGEAFRRVLETIFDIAHEAKKELKELEGTYDEESITFFESHLEICESLIKQITSPLY